MSGKYHIEVDGGKIVRAARATTCQLVVDGAEHAVGSGTLILPGFVDTHCHLIGLGMMNARVQLAGARSAAECAQLVAERASRTPVGEWVVGYGWNQELWDDKAWPDRTVLDGVVDRHPVILHRVDTHAVWINSRAMEIVGLGMTEVPGGEILLSPDGRPTGVLVDAATAIVERALPVPDEAARQQWIRDGVEQCLAFGITEIHDMNVNTGTLETMTAIAERGDMRLRCRVFLSGLHGNWRVLPQPIRLAPNLDTVGVKFFADGALGSRGAFLLEPYDDAAGRGLCLVDAESLAHDASDAVQAGYAVATHAIADAANRLVLDAYEMVRARTSAAVLRIEHAQIVHDDDVVRFARLNVLPAVQPTHCISDATMAEARLGLERCRGAYRWNSFLKAGLPLLAGSDFPVESPDPLAGLRAFVHRQPAGHLGPWNGDEAVGIDAGLCSYTEWAQRGVPGNAQRGRLEPGMDADLVLLEGDPIGEGQVIATFVAGREVYRRA